VVRWADLICRTEQERGKNLDKRPRSVKNWHCSRLQ